MNDEAEFAYRIRQVLDESAERLDYRVILRLQKARQAALERGVAKQAATVWVPALQLASEGVAPAQDSETRKAAWLLRFGFAAPLLVLALGIVGIQQWHSERTVAEAADLDFAVLLDDTPIDTYAHQGFGVYLREEQGQ